jgi:hypothetical protein
MESILVIILMLALIGVVLWAVLRFVPMPSPWPQVIIAVAAILVLLWLLRGIGGVALP